MSSPQQIVVVGTSLAGLRGIESLRREGYEGRIVAIGAEPQLPYDRPPLSKQFLAGSWEEDRLALRRDGIDDLDVDWRLGSAVRSLHAKDLEIEIEDGVPTPLGRTLALFPEIQLAMPAWYLPALALLLPILGCLMVSRVRYPHTASLLFKGQGKFPNLVGLVFVFFLLYLAPVPVLFLTGIGYVLWGLVLSPFGVRARRSVAVEPKE